VHIPASVLRVPGGDGRDRLNGGAGNDRLDGGVGVKAEDFMPQLQIII